MTPAAILFLLVNALALLALPRRLAPLPLLVGACYMTLGQGVDVGPFRFTVIRLLALAGFIRVLVRSERPAGGLNGMDWLMVVWAIWALVSSAFHEEPKSQLIGQLGLTYNVCGIYFLLRCFCQTTEDIVLVIKMTALLLVPVALEMIHEHLTRQNLFAIFGGVSEAVTLRNGKPRAQGPFAHGILAGTVGAVCTPLMIGIWRQHATIAKVGLAACVVIVLASNSSGPLMSVQFAALALILWRWRHLTRQMRIAAVVGYILLDIVMKAPAYFLIARIDLTGGSTGWHRAELIRSSIEHLREWWFAGTDHTRHWMPTGVSWSENHTDITNHYLQMGVVGGLPLMLLLILIMWRGFSYVGQLLELQSAAPFEDRFLVWSLGAALFAHAATCISVSYFDQSFLFLYLNLALISSLRSTASAAVESESPGVENPVAAPVVDTAPRLNTPLCGGRAPDPVSSALH